MTCEEDKISALIESLLSLGKKGSKPSCEASWLKKNEYEAKCDRWLRPLYNKQEKEAKIIEYHISLLQK